MPTRDDPRGGRVGSATLRTARNAAALTAAELVGKVFTFAYTIVAARVLSQDDFGNFAYALALSLLVVVLPKWGFNADVIRQGSRDREQLDRLLGASLVWTLLVGTASFGVTYLVASGPRGRDAAVVLALLLVATLLDSVSDRLRAGAAAIERQTAASVALIANRVVTGVAIVALLLGGGGVVGMGLGYLAGSALDVVLAVVVVRREGIHPRLRVSRSDLGLALRGSWVLGLSAVAAMMLFRVDQVIIDALVGAAALAAYAVAYRLVETVLFLSWSLSRAILPVLSGAASSDRVLRGLGRGVGVLAVVYVPFAVVAVVEPGPSLRLLFGGEYVVPATPVLQWLAPAPLLFGVAFLASYVLVAQGREWWALTANVVATVLNVGLNLWLVPRHGITAAAVVTSVTLAARAVVAVGATQLPGAWRVVAAATTNALVAAAVLTGVLVVLHAHVLVELALGGAAYATVWVLVTRWRSPDEIAVLRAMLPARGS